VRFFLYAAPVRSTLSDPPLSSPPFPSTTPCPLAATSNPNRPGCENSRHLTCVLPRPARMTTGSSVITHQHGWVTRGLPFHPPFPFLSPGLVGLLQVSCEEGEKGEPELSESSTPDDPTCRRSQSARVRDRGNKKLPAPITVMVPLLLFITDEPPNETGTVTTASSDGTIQS
jgi:hypothetical protein